MKEITNNDDFAERLILLSGRLDDIYYTDVNEVNETINEIKTYLTNSNTDYLIDWLNDIKQVILTKEFDDANWLLKEYDILYNYIAMN